MDKLWTKGTASAVPHSPGLMRALAPEIRFLPRSWKHQSCLAKELSSRPEEAWACCPPKGHEKHLGPATTFYETVALSFVIPSEAEGSAVPRSFPENAEIYPQTKCHLDRSVPGFPATQHWKRPRVRLSVRKAA
jgi:hypothetical protein